MLNQVIVVIPTVNVCVFENVYLNSSVKNCGCFKCVITFVISLVVFVHRIGKDMISCSLKGESRGVLMWVKVNTDI
jgi:hypothetical protein